MHSYRDWQYHTRYSCFYVLIEAKFCICAFFFFSPITHLHSVVRLLITLNSNGTLILAWTELLNEPTPFLFIFDHEFFDESYLFGCILSPFKVLSIFYETLCIFNKDFTILYAYLTWCMSHILNMMRILHSLQNAYFHYHTLFAKSTAFYFYFSPAEGI